MNTSISSRVSPLRLFYVINPVRDHRLLSTESVKNGTVDVRLDFECKKNVPANTIIYWLIIHDRMIQYNPLINIVRKT